MNKARTNHSSVQCEYYWWLVHDSKGRIVEREKCGRPALWMIDKKKFCCNCFESYLASHPDIDFALITRLSDNELDFSSERVDVKPERNLEKEILA
jgi:hypothetical protein